MNSKITACVVLFGLVATVGCRVEETTDEPTAHAEAAWTVVQACNVPQTNEQSAPGRASDSHVEHFPTLEACDAYRNAIGAGLTSCFNADAVLQEAVDDATSDCEKQLGDLWCPSDCSAEEVTTTEPCHTVGGSYTTSSTGGCERAADGHYMVVCTVIGVATVSGTAQVVCRDNGSGSGSGI